MLESDEFKRKTKNEGYTDVQNALVKEIMTLTEKEAQIVIDLLNSLHT